MSDDLNSVEYSAKVGGRDEDVKSSSFVDLNTILRAVRKLPADERKGYDLAVEKAPNLVVKETDPLRFLRLEDGDIQGAAKRLVEHWNLRREVFGERYTLRLDLSGEGALAPDDIATLKKSYLFILPSTLERTYVFFDLTKVGQQGLDSMFRSLFYLAFQAWKREKPVTLIRYSESPIINKQKILKLLGVYESMSLKVDRVLCVYKPPPGTISVFRQAIAPIVEGFIQEHKRACAFRSIIGESPQELLSQLRLEGFDFDWLPSCVGGKVKSDEIRESFEAQESCDVEFLKNASLKNPPLPQRKSETYPNSMLARKAEKLSALNNLASAAKIKAQEERKVRKRKLDVLYARNRRQQERDEEEHLKKKCFALSIANMALEVEEKRLQALLAGATAKVNMLAKDSMRQRRRFVHSATSQLASFGTAKSLEMQNFSQAIDCACSLEMQLGILGSRPLVTTSSTLSTPPLAATFQQRQPSFTPTDSHLLYSFAVRAQQADLTGSFTSYQGLLTTLGGAMPRLPGPESYRLLLACQGEVPMATDGVVATNTAIMACASQSSPFSHSSLPTSRSPALRTPQTPIRLANTSFQSIPTSFSSSVSSSLAATRPSFLNDSRSPLHPSNTYRYGTTDHRSSSTKNNIVD